MSVERITSEKAAEALHRGQDRGSTKVDGNLPWAMEAADAPAGATPVVNFPSCQAAAAPRAVTVK